MQVLERPTELEPGPQPAPTGERAPSRADNPTWMRVLLLAFVVAPLFALGYAIWQLWQREVFWIDIALLVGFYTFAQIGVTVGYHRYLTHRGFVAPTWLKFTLLVLGSMAIEGPALTWASTHLEHHAKSDREGDPHSPLDGFIHAHVGWIIDGFYHDASKYGHWLEK